MEKKSRVLVVTWTIENFLFCTQRNGEFLSSPGFAVDGVHDRKWHLHLYPRGSGIIRGIELYLSKARDIYSTSVEFELSFLHKDGRVDVVLRRCKGNFSNENPTHGVMDFVKRSKVLSELGEYPSKSSFAVRCRFWLPKEAGPGGQCFLRTRIGIQRSACSWILDELLDKKQLLPIQFVTSEDVKVYLLCYITYGQRCAEKLNVDIELPFNTSHCFGWCRLNILDKSKNFEQCLEEEFWLKTQPFATAWKFQPFLTAGKQQKGYFSKRTIILLCDLVLSEGVIHECVEETARYPDSLEKWFPSIQPESKAKIQTLHQSDMTVHSGTLARDLQSMHTENTMYDIKLRTHTSTFPTHRVILCARSPVFRAMFDDDMKEKLAESVDVVDLEDDIVRILLKFMYTDTVEELRIDTAKKLHYAADKYQVLHLKKICADFFTGNLSADNVCEVLTLADVHHDEELKKAATDFVLSSYKTVFESEQWKTFMEENCRLAAQVMFIKCTKE